MRDSRINEEGGKMKQFCLESPRLSTFIPPPSSAIPGAGDEI
jgi:hypothetical protein